MQRTIKSWAFSELGSRASSLSRDFKSPSEAASCTGIITLKRGAEGFSADEVRYVMADLLCLGRLCVFLAHSANLHTHSGSLAVSLFSVCGRCPSNFLGDLDVA